MARSKFFNLWGQKAETEDDDKKKPEETGAAAEAAALEDEEAEETGAEGDETAEEASAEFDDEEDEKEEDDEATTAEVAKVSKKAQASIRRAERRRVHAIVKEAGASRIEAGLNLALGSGISVAAAKHALRATGAEVPPGGRLGLAGSMDGRRRAELGADGGPQPGGGKSDADKAAAFILGAGKH